MSNNSSTASRVAAHNSKGVPYTGWIEGVGYLAANSSIDWAVARKKGALIYPGELLEIPPVFEEANAQNRPAPRAQVVDAKSFYGEKGRGTNWMDLYQSDYSGFTLGSGLYNTTIDFAVKSSAAELRNSRYLVRGYNLSVEAAKLTKLSMRLNVAGGVVGALDNGVQAVNDFSNGRNRRGYVQATQATAYTLGTGLLFVPIPGARLLGGAIILGAGVSDLVEWVIETDW